MANRKAARKPVSKSDVLDRVFRKDASASIWVYREGTPAWENVPEPWKSTAHEMIVVEGEKLIDRWVRLGYEDDWQQCPSAVLEDAWQTRGSFEWAEHWAGTSMRLADACRESIEDGKGRDARMASER